MFQREREKILIRKEIPNMFNLKLIPYWFLLFVVVVLIYVF